MARNIMDDLREFHAQTGAERLERAARADLTTHAIIQDIMERNPITREAVTLKVAA